MKVFCIGRNYANHIAEMNALTPKFPLFFMKPDTAVLTKNKDFYYPEFTKELHYECEIVVKICKVGKNIAEKFADNYYKEISVGIDFTARDLQQNCKKNGEPWEIAKSFDNSAPVGKFINLENKNIQNINFVLEKNGEIVQYGNTKNMIFSVNQIIAHLSQFFTLKVGDLIFTGTPEGVGSVKINEQLTAYIENEQLLNFKIK